MSPWNIRASRTPVSGGSVPVMVISISEPSCGRVIRAEKLSAFPRLLRCFQIDRMARCPTTSTTSQEITAPPMPLMRCRMYRRTASKSSRAGKAGGSSPTMTRMMSFATLCQVGAPVRVAEGMGSHPARSNCMVSTCFIPRPRYLEAHCTSETEAYFRLTLCSTISLPMKMLALALAAFAAVSASAQTSSTQTSSAQTASAQTSGDHLYKQSAKYVLGGEGGWDYLTYDPDGARLFITRGYPGRVVGAGEGK